MSESDDERRQREHQEYMRKQNEDAYQRELGRKGHDTGTAASKEGYREYQSQKSQQSSSNNGCFSADTLIKSEYGLRKICEFSKGDKIITFNRDSGRLQTCAIRRVKSAISNSIFEIYEEDSKIPTRVSPLHAFMTPLGYRRANQLTIGMKLYKFEPSAGLICKEVRTISKKSLNIDVFNLYVDDQHSFIANGYLVSSFSHLIDFRKWLHNTYHSLTNISPPHTEEQPAN